MPMTLLGRKQDKEALRKQKENRAILDDLHKTRDELRAARTRFNQACEPELVDACVYEINALQARYAYFLRQAREHKMEQSYVNYPRSYEEDLT